jgi:hypothetical protein
MESLDLAATLGTCKSLIDSTLVPSSPKGSAQPLFGFAAFRDREERDRRGPERDASGRHACAFETRDRVARPQSASPEVARQSVAGQIGRRIRKARTQAGMGTAAITA